MGREKAQAKTQRVRVQAVEEVPGDPVWWHGMCGGQEIHTKGLKCQAESFFSRLKGRAFSELTLAKMAPLEEALSTKESGGWVTRGENLGPGLPVSFLPNPGPGLGKSLTN